MDIQIENRCVDMVGNGVVGRLGRLGLTYIHFSSLGSLLALRL